MAEFDEVISRHGYHGLRVVSIVQETADTRSFVLDVPEELRALFAYRPGQFCTFRIHVDGAEHARCYSMSSAPETDEDLTVTVKRVPGGVVSNWLNDVVAVGDVLEVSPPAGTFTIGTDARPIVAFCGGSGVTPLLSITKSALAASSPVRLLYANRDRDSVIFEESLSALRARHAEALELRHHLDSDGGFLTPGTIVDFVGDTVDGPGARYYICGPAPFMDLVEAALLDIGVEPGDILIERFVTPSAGESSEPAPGPGSDDATAVPDTITLVLRGKRHEIEYRTGDTVLETARRANLAAPYSCEAGNCATCMALVRDGAVSMRVNNALTDEEVEEGWVLTCQSVPISPSLTIEYEAL